MHCVTRCHIARKGPHAPHPPTPWADPVQHPRSHRRDGQCPAVAARPRPVPAAGVGGVPGLRWYGAAGAASPGGSAAQAHPDGPAPPCPRPTPHHEDPEGRLMLTLILFTTTNVLMAAAAVAHWTGRIARYQVSGIAALACV